MDQNAFVVKTLTKKEYFSAGHRACAAAVSITGRRHYRKLSANVIVASATGCMEIVSSPFP